MSAVLLIRHGQASFGAEDYDNLSALGLEQSKRLGLALRPRIGEMSLAAAGTQLRHHQTAKACLEAFDAPPEIRQLSGLNEYDHHEVLVRCEPRYADPDALARDVLSGSNPRLAFQELFAKAVARWISGEHDEQYTESWTAVKRRSVEALRQITQALGPSQTALVFTSGGVISAICQELLALGDKEAIRVSWTLVNCGISKVLVSSRGLRLSTLNEHGHLEAPGQNLITYR